MCSIASQGIWLILLILRLRMILNDVYTNTRMRLVGHQVLYNHNTYSVVWAEQCGWGLCRDSAPVGYLPLTDGHFWSFLFWVSTMLQQQF